MKFLYILICGLGFFVLRSQNDCQFTDDTLYLPHLSKTINASYTEVTTKNNSKIQFFKQGNTYYLRIIATVNLYFGKTDLLEIKSGNKSFFVKNTTQFEQDKDHGSYTITIFKNYIATLRDGGITSIKFGAAETKYESRDTEAIRKMAKCFYETISTK